MKKIFIITLLFISTVLYAQEQNGDSLQINHLKEVIVISNTPGKTQNETKVLATLDSYLESAANVNMIKRGAYAWEPVLMGMTTERSVITIDGMRIHGACTDKMDPITSYVEISNLAEANINSGQSGAENGATIAGNIDLVRRKSGFKEFGWKGSLLTGMESSNYQKVAGATLHYSGKDFFADIDFMYRDAENYKAGGGQEVPYSQYTKYNLSAITGFKINEKQQIEASVIYDEATDVGYSALPMDVSLARAFIGSLEYLYRPENGFISHWDTKIYYNSITHIMDDSHRPDVPIRMDMPGWSNTMGMYSKAKGVFKNHTLQASLTTYYNTALAEMTMYPNAPEENEMFMITWPDVGTLYYGIFAEDQIGFSENWNLTMSIGLGVHSNAIRDKFGLQSLQIFYPNMTDNNTRLLKNIATTIQHKNKQWNYSFGLGYGERAPSVSEGYGFYLFNSFDGFDYIGNPFLKNEKSAEINTSIAFKEKNFSTRLQASYFYMNDYIIGKPNPDFLPMTIGANGIKVYEQLNYATIWNTSLTLQYKFIKNWSFSGTASYRQGEDFDGNYLPLIQPFSYESNLRFRKDLFFAEIGLEGAAKQTRFSPEFGELKTDNYLVFNLAASQIIYIGKQKITLKAGGENLFDAYYSTFADWNNIPRMGRNLFVNVVYEL